MLGHPFTSPPRLKDKWERSGAGLLFLLQQILNTKAHKWKVPHILCFLKMQFPFLTDYYEILWLKIHSFDMEALAQSNNLGISWSIDSHKFITIELGKTSVLEFWGKLSTMSSCFCVVWENHGVAVNKLGSQSWIMAESFDSIRKPKLNHFQHYFWMRLENQSS